MWRHFIFGNPEQTFWGMVDAGLQTEGVTKYVRQEGESGYGEQYLQLQLGETNAARSITTIAETGATGQTSTVVTETIGTPDANYVQYRQIESTETLPDGSMADFSSVLGKWGKEEVASGLNQSVFNEALFGVVPFGRLNPKQRQELIKSMQENQVYTVDYKNATRIDYGGKGAYEYQVEIKPDAYISMLKQFDSMMGLGRLTGLDESEYRLSAPIELQMVVGIDARQLLDVTYVQAERNESYGAYGANANIQIPEQYVSRQELEQKLNNVLGQ